MDDILALAVRMDVFRSTI
ncbi:hypothetical protein LINGRAPRIM_LOCUS1078 [Linum grandiflorum]